MPAPAGSRLVAIEAMKKAGNDRTKIPRRDRWDQELSRYDGHSDLLADNHRGAAEGQVMGEFKDDKFIC